MLTLTVDPSSRLLPDCPKEQRHLNLAANISKPASNSTMQKGVIEMMIQDCKPAELSFGRNITRMTDFMWAIFEH